MLILRMFKLLSGRKTYAVNVCTAYAAQYGVNVISARLAQTLVWEFFNRKSCVCTICKKRMRGENIVPHTTGESEGNYVYTADAIAAIMTLFSERKAGEAYNIAMR